MKNQPVCLILSCLFLYSFNLKSQDTLRVPQDYATIQSALDGAVTNTVILVSAGTYVETLKWPSIILGIQLKSISGRDSTIIDGNQLDRVIDKRSVADDPESVIEGFTIQNGKVGFGSAGGIYIVGRGTTLRNLKVSKNQATGTNGGGAYLQTYSGIIENCIFTENKISASLAAWGGGLYISLDGPVDLRNSSFTLNITTGQNGSYGAGLYADNYLGFDFLIHKCTFSKNMAITNFNAWCRGGGMYLEGLSVLIDSCLIEDNVAQLENISEGGGIYSTVNNFTLRNSTVNTNMADFGYAIMFDADEACTNTILNCLIQGNRHKETNTTHHSCIEARSPSSSLTLRNCVILNNRGRGILINNDIATPFQLVLSHCTLYRNFGSLELHNTHAVINNSILWNILYEFVLNDPNEIEVNYSDVAGGFNGNNVINSNPMFASIFDYIPLEGSPCLSAGNPWLAEPLDINGNRRPLPSKTLPDLGAVEVRQSIAFVNLKFYYDFNENGIRDSTERFAQIGAVKINNDKTYTNFESKGLLIAVDTGLLNIVYNDAFYTNWKITSDPSYTAYVDTNAFFQVVEFGMAPITGEEEAKTYINLNPFRCNEQIKMHVTVANENSYINSSIVWLRLDDRIDTYSFEILPDTILDQHTIGWYVQELYPTESLTYDGYVKAPGIGNGIHAGDIFKFTSWIEGIEAGSTFAYDAELRCSFDPNDKLINPVRPDSLALIDAPLFYTIRFQNTGNDYARNLSIIDTLDQDLDLSTFRLIHTSHPDQLEVIFHDDNVVMFTFKNIFLPDSTTNFEASSGHIAYTIKAKADVERKSVIQNKAEIFFDFNPAVSTNTTSSVMVDDFTTALSPIHELENVMYPNPTNGNIFLTSRQQEVRIFDCNGILLEKYYDIQHLDLNHLHQGLYIIKLLKDGDYATYKVALVR